MQNNPLVSIVIPTYNAEAFLEETLASVLAQTYTNWECIIVNDGSTDNSLSIAKKWKEKDTRFHIINKENEGLSRARNTGIENAKANYIAFLDSDDIWMPQHLSVLLDLILQYQTDVVYSYGYQLIKEEYTKHPVMGNDAIAKANSGIEQGKNGIISFLYHNKIIPSFTLCKKQCLIDTQGFTYYKNAEDFHLWLKLLFNHCSFFFYKKATGYYRIIENSLSSKDRSSFKETLEIISLLKTHFVEFNLNYYDYFNLWARRYFLLKDDKKHFLEAIKYINSLEYKYFRILKIIGTFLPKKLLKLLVLSILKKK